MITSESAMLAMRSLVAIPFFPSDEIAQTIIANELTSFCETNEQAQWLVAKMIRTYSSWPGPREMRAAFCSRFRPRDGFDIGSSVYPDGIPSDREQLPQLAGPALPVLAPPANPDPVADAELMRKVREAAVKMSELRPVVHAPVSSSVPINITPPRPVVLKECGCNGSGRRGKDEYCACDMGRTLYGVEHKDDERHSRAREFEVVEQLRHMGL